QMFYHTGDILIANGGTLTSSEEVMVEGYTLVENGGTFTITEDIVNLGYFEIATTANFTNTDDLILSGNSITIIDNTSFGADDIYIDHTDATLCGDGIMNLGNGGADPTIQFFNGGSLNQVCSTFSVTCTSNCGAFPITPTGNFSSGNSGPAGVATTNGSSELEYWIDANSGVSGTSPITAWNDLSGNGITNTINGNPVLTTGALNGRSVITFDGAGDRIQTNLSINAGTRPDLSIISVYVPVSSTNSGTVWGESNGNYDRVLTAANGLGGCTNATTNGSICINNASLFPAGNSVITSVVFDEDVASGSRAYTNGTSVLTFTSNHAPGDGSNAMQVGDAGVGGFIPYTGGIAEIIVLSNVVNTAKRIIIENYLDAKYHNDGAPAFVNDVYTMDNSSNGNYDFEVAGIGQAADGSNHRDGKGPGVVRMWNPNNLGNSEFLMWGHDNTVLTSTTTASPADVDGTVIEERLSRIWRVSESGGDVGTVSLSFDFNSIGGSPLGSNLRLLIDRDGDGFGDNDVTPIVGSVSAGIAVFSNVNFQDGDHFTLGNTDASVPLPIELLIFEAKPASDLVLINWTTASELNNDHFMVQRSRNAEEWEDVVKIKGAGTVSEQKNYQAVDPQPYQGESYYRLKQSDFDGTISFSRIERVSFIGIPSLVVNPNPSSGIFRVSGVGSTAPSQIRVYNAVGQLITPELRSDNTEVLIDLNSYPPGVYILQIAEGALLRSVRIIKS
ncbi:MAG: T9SS type A sorting domain-containing protein, partial [Cyclobacteriaceae bacterium]